VGKLSRAEEGGGLSSDEDASGQLPARRRKRKRHKRVLSLVAGLDTFTAGLIWVGVVGLLSLGIALIWSSASFLPVALGWSVAVFGGLWFFALVFEDNAMAAVLCLFVPIYALYYLVTHFETMERPFLVAFVGSALAVVGSFCR
jgi:hypothetical protein